MVAISVSEPSPEISSPFSINVDNLNLSWLAVQHAKRSLGNVAEDCFGLVGIQTTIPTNTPVWNFISIQIILTGDINSAIIQALTNWYRLQYVVASGIADKVLSWNQRYSYQLLYDWLMATFQDPSKSLSELNEFIELSDTLKNKMDETTDREVSHRDLWACIDRHKNALMLGGASVVEDMRDSSYNQALRRLFIIEFLTPSVYPTDNMSHIRMLDSARKKAALEAYFLQAKAEGFGPPLPGLSLHKLSEDKGSCPWICSVEASDLKYPRTLGRGPLIRACPWLDPTTSTSSQQPYIGNTSIDDLDGWPEYLWHIESHRIIRTRDLEERHPAYIAISHTWGRWQRKNEQGLIEQVLIEGGLGLTIPQNDKFDVKKLPDMLVRLKSAIKVISVDYVWLDLLCIPQVAAERKETPDMKKWLKIQKKEIARQGPIFRNAQAAIAWLHDVDDLSCLGAICKLLSLTKLLDEANDSVKQQYKSLIEATLDSIIGRRTGLVSDKREDRRSNNRSIMQLYNEFSETPEPTGWFTSLWTLQEVCLRPDMWLATSNWDVLTISENKPVPLNGFMVILRSGSFQGLSDEERLKPALMEIFSWCISTGLNDILELSMLDILRLGDRRYCKERRAEAIMSAMGVTDWFLREPECDPNLILGKYPQAFISEVRERIPGIFFSIFAKTPHADPHDDLQITATGQGLNGHPIMVLYENNFSSSKPTNLNGSLLPFSEIGHMYNRTPRHINTSPEMDPHDSIHSWGINTTGKVKIEQACIISSSTLDNIKKSPKKLPCIFWGFKYRTRGCQSSSERKVDMHEWTAARKSEIHMVVVMHGPCQQPDIPKDANTRTAVYHKDENKGFLNEQGYAVQGIVVRCIKKDSKRTAEKQGKIREANGKPQRLVKIGNFYASCAGELVLPDTQKVSWEIL